MKIRKKLVTASILVLLVISLTGCSAGTSGKKGEDWAVDPVSGLAGKVKSFKVTSESVGEDGVLDTACCYTDAAPKGENQSPQLSWEIVSDATCYTVYMYDADAQNFLHWRVADLTETNMKQGAMHMLPMYMGPFPPEGTHHYQITVYALKTAPQLYEGKVGKRGNVEEIEEYMDVVDGKSGNVVGVGILNCTVTRGK